MTAPDRTTWTVAEDGWGDPTIWTDGDHAVATRRGDRIHIDPAYAEQVWQVLTRVFAPDEATIERLAEAIHDHACPSDPDAGCGWFEDAGENCDLTAFTGFAEAVLAALTGTSAQARHTDDDATGGGA